MISKNIISPRGTDSYLLVGRMKRYAELTGISNCKNGRIKSLSDNKLIGRFSSLSVSKLANITSFYEGKAYYYVMNKDIDQLHIDLLYEKDTDEPNGVEVKIPWDKEKTLSADDWASLAFIKNVYIQDDRNLSSYRADSAIASIFNKREVFTYDSFRYLKIGFRKDDCYVLVGDIPYRVDLHEFLESSFIYDWQETFEEVYPNVKIGEVDVTPNREGLLYSDRTKRVLEKAYLDAAAELTKMFHDSCEEEKSNFIEFAKAHYSGSNNYVKLGNTMIEICRKLPKRIKYHGFEDLNQELVQRVIRTFMNTGNEFVVARLSGHVLERKFKSWYWDFQHILNRLEDSDTVSYVVPDAVGMTGTHFKGYLESKYGSKDVIFLKHVKITKSAVRQFIQSKFGISALSSSEEIHVIIKVIRELIREIASYSIVTDIIESQAYMDYKLAHRIKKTYVRDTTKITAHVYYPNFGAETVYTDTVETIIRKIKQHDKKARIVYAKLNSPFIGAVRKLDFPHVIPLSLSQNYYKMIDHGLFPEWIKPIESLYSPNERHLKRLAAIQYIKAHCSLNQPESWVPAPMREKIKDLISRIRQFPFVGTFDEAHSFIDLIEKKDYDYTLISCFNEVKDMMAFSSRHSRVEDLELYVLMKEKKFRMDFERYRRIRERINILLDENNQMQ